MTTSKITDPATRLRALAADARSEFDDGSGDFWLALAKHAEGAALRIEQRQAFWAEVSQAHPPLSLEAQELLAVADAAGIAP